MQDRSLAVTVSFILPEVTRAPKTKFTFTVRDWRCGFACSLLKTHREAQTVAKHKENGFDNFGKSNSFKTVKSRSSSCTASEVEQ